MRFTGNFLLLVKLVPLAILGFSSLASANAEPLNDITPFDETSNILSGYSSNEFQPRSTALEEDDDDDDDNVAGIQMRATEDIGLESILAQALTARDLTFEDEDEDEDDVKQAFNIFNNKLFNLRNERRGLDDLHAVLKNQIYEAFEENDFDKAASISSIFQKIKGLFSKNKNKGTSRADPGPGPVPRPDSPTLGPYSSSNLKRAVENSEFMDNLSAEDNDLDNLHAVFKRDFYDALEDLDFEKLASITTLFKKFKGLFSSKNKNKGTSRADPGPGPVPRPDSPTLGPWSSSNLKRAIENSELVDDLSAEDNDLDNLHAVLKRDFYDALEDLDFEKIASISSLIKKFKGLFSSKNKNKGTSRADPGPGPVPRPDSPTLGPWSSSNLKRAVQDVDAFLRSELLASFGDNEKTVEVIDGIVRKVGVMLAN